MTENKITLIIADDHPVFRAGLTQIIRTATDIDLTGEASDGAELIQLVKERHPDLILIDIDMPNITGLQVAEELKKWPSSPKIIFLTLYEDEEFFNRALDLGVHGFLLKENASSDILSAVRSVAAGKYYISPSVSDFMIRRSEGSKILETQFPGLKSLTTTEQKVLHLIAGGKTTREISESLFVSIKTTETHRTNISKKLNLSGSQTLVKFAIENKNQL